MAEYIVLSPVRHDQKRYEVAATIRLSKAAAEPLIAVGVISEPASEPVPPVPSDALMLINTAQAASELVALPSIGAVNAERIFLGRPDNGYANLAAVKDAPSLTSGIDWDAIASWEALE